MACFCYNLPKKNHGVNNFNLGKKKWFNLNLATPKSEGTRFAWFYRWFMAIVFFVLFLSVFFDAWDHTLQPLKKCNMQTTKKILRFFIASSFLLGFLICLPKKSLQTMWHSSSCLSLVQQNKSSQKKAPNMLAKDEKIWQSKVVGGMKKDTLFCH